MVGTKKVWSMLQEKKAIAAEFRLLHEVERRAFLEKRKKYLIPSYTAEIKKEG
ncbi:MAG: hypothetical protein ACK5MA_00205 [Parachlamydiaceae bacterium]